jgi:hypothetical protein
MRCRRNSRQILKLRRNAAAYKESDMMRYIGEGAFAPGIPARDLTDAEVNEFGKETLLATGLYVEAEMKAQKIKSAKESEA